MRPSRAPDNPPVLIACFLRLVSSGLDGRPGAASVDGAPTVAGAPSAAEAAAALKKVRQSSPGLLFFGIVIFSPGFGFEAGIPHGPGAHYLPSAGTQRGRTPVLGSSRAASIAPTHHLVERGGAESTSRQDLFVGRQRPYAEQFHSAPAKNRTNAPRCCVTR
jgi:hypothetical protein